MGRVLFGIAVLRFISLWLKLKFQVSHFALSHVDRYPCWLRALRNSGLGLRSVSGENNALKRHSNPKPPIKSLPKRR